MRFDRLIHLGILSLSGHPRSSLTPPWGLRFMLCRRSSSWRDDHSYCHQEIRARHLSLSRCASDLRVRGRPACKNNRGHTSAGGIETASAKTNELVFSSHIYMNPTKKNRYKRPHSCRALRRASRPSPSLPNLTDPRSHQLSTRPRESGHPKEPTWPGRR